MTGLVAIVPVMATSRVATIGKMSQGSDSTALQAPADAGRAGPPDTSYYMKLGYAVAIAIFAAYIALLLKRVASVRRSR